MNFFAIITISIIIIILIIIYRITKKIILTLSLFFLITTILLVIFGFAAYSDFKNFKQGMESGEKIILLVDDEVITGVTLTTGSEYQSFDEEKLKEYSNYYQNKEYNKILEDKFIIFLVKYPVLENNLEDKDLKNITKAEVSSSLKSDNSQELKANLFIMSFSAILQSKTPILLIQEHKKGNIEIYPDYLVIKIIRKVPIEFLNRFIS